MKLADGYDVLTWGVLIAVPLLIVVFATIVVVTTKGSTKWI